MRKKKCGETEILRLICCLLERCLSTKNTRKEMETGEKGAFIERSYSSHSHALFETVLLTRFTDGSFLARARLFEDYTRILDKRRLSANKGKVPIYNILPIKCLSPNAERPTINMVAPKPLAASTSCSRIEDSWTRCDRFLSKIHDVA